MSVLLVWDDRGCDDGLKFFIIEPTSEQLSVLQLANDCYINATSDERRLASVEMICNAVSREDYAIKDEEDNVMHADWVSIWKNCEMKTPIVCNISKVFHCGFAV